MSDLRVDRIGQELGALHEKVDGLGSKIDGVEERLDAVELRLDAKIDDLAAKTEAGFRAAYVQTQAAFEEHRAFTVFLVERSERQLRDEMRQGFSRIEGRFDRLEERLFRHR